MTTLLSLLPRGRRAWRGLLLGLLALAGCTSADEASPEPARTTQTGAATRFVVQGSRLYAIDNQNLQVYDISSSATGTSNTYGPAHWQRTVPVGLTIQALYPAGSRLFVGTPSGLLLLDVSNPQLPAFSSFVPATSCDPLASDGRWAYLSLRADQPCGGGTNQLQVVDLIAPQQPRTVQNYPLGRPYGLSLLSDSAQLFVCDNGLKVYTTRQAPTLTLLDQLSVAALDVQAADGLLLVTSSEALTQYRYANRSLQFLSSLPITRP